MFSHLRFARVHLLAAIALLAGCGVEGENRSPVVAATVNNAEISVHQVSRMVGPEGRLEEPQGGPDDVAVLERLIDQELIVQKARQRHLERDPEVAQELEASRREILVRAYLDRAVGPVDGPSEEEIRDFYNANPALFEARRIYELEEIVVQMESGHFEALQMVVSDTRGLDGVLDWLKERGLVVQTTKAVRAAEQLPIESLDAFARMQRGRVVVSSTPTGARLIHLVSARSEPLDIAAARPLIEEYLMNDRMVEAARAELARLRGSARILYGDDFTQGESAQSVGSASPKVQDGAAEGALDPSEPVQAAFERGVAGLK